MKRPSPRRRMIRELCRVFAYAELASDVDYWQSMPDKEVRLMADSWAGRVSYGRVARSASHYMRRYVAGRRLS